MRFVAVKSEKSQAAAVIFRTRDLLVRQRTQLINALRGHMGEFGLIVPQGASQAGRLIAMVADPDAPLPDAARPALSALVSALERLEGEICRLEAEITRRAKDDEVARRLMTIPGVGPLIATAFAVLAPPPETFRRGRDFAAWLGLTPRQHSTGGRQRLGATTRMGERFLRRLLILGTNSVIIKRHVHAAARPGSWLARMLSRKPPMPVRVALANKMARVVWALMKKAEDYRAPGATARASERRRARSGMAQRSRDGIRQSRLQQSATEHAALMWGLVREHHSGPRHPEAAAKAGQMSAPDHAPRPAPKIPLAQRGGYRCCRTRAGFLLQAERVRRRG